MAASEIDATDIARRIGYPVVLKLLSDKLTHKARVNGVKLNLRDEQEVIDAYRVLNQPSLKDLAETPFRVFLFSRCSRSPVMN